MKILAVTAHNPKGLNFDTTAKSVADLRAVIARIKFLGGEDIRVNGHELPADWN